MFRLVYKLFKDITSFRKLTVLRNKHKGEKVFIIATGPSLNSADLDSLSNEITFGCNKAWLFTDKWGWIPDYYFVADDLVIGQNHDRIQDYLDSKSIIGFTERMPVNEIRSIKIDCLTRGQNQVGVSEDLRLGWYSGTTITFRMIQAAIYMGFKTIVLTGLDFSYETTNDLKDGNVLISEQGTMNHALSEYRAPGEKWNLPKMEEQRKAFMEIECYAKRKGIKIINASRVSKLDVFERQDLSQLL
jgi:hypothetical protein